MPLSSNWRHPTKLSLILGAIPFLIILLVIAAFVPQPAFVLDISPHWERKLAAIQCFESQFIIGRPQDPPTFLDRLRDEAAYWGKTIGVQYGEPFTCREPVGLSTMRSLI